jgi:hypothetical protein
MTCPATPGDRIVCSQALLSSLHRHCLGYSFTAGNRVLR